MTQEAYTTADIATVRQVLSTPSGERILTAVKMKNTPAYDPTAHQDATTIAFRAAYNQGFDDCLKYLRDILQPTQRLEDMRTSTFHTEND